MRSKIILIGLCTWNRKTSSEKSVFIHWQSDKEDRRTRDGHGLLYHQMLILQLIGWRFPIICFYTLDVITVDTFILGANPAQDTCILHWKAKCKRLNTAKPERSIGITPNTATMVLLDYMGSPGLSSTEISSRLHITAKNTGIIHFQRKRFLFWTQCHHKMDGR